MVFTRTLQFFLAAFLLSTLVRPVSTYCFRPSGSAYQWPKVGYQSTTGARAQKRPAGRFCARNLIKLRAAISVSGPKGGGLQDASSRAWEKFLGVATDEVRDERVLVCDRVYEDGLMENRADHIRECNVGPWGRLKRVVAQQDREYVSNLWDRHGAGLTDREQMVAIGRNGLLTPSECESIIREAEATAMWTKSFPHASKTREESMPDRVKVEELPETLSWLTRTLPRRISPAIEQAFPECAQCKAQYLRPYQAIVLRYDADSDAGPVSTPVHQDFSFITLTVPLNDPAQYQGGGTWLHPLQRSVRPNVGHPLAHSGRVWHGGHPVTSGTRYALAIFFHSSQHVDHGRRFEQRATGLIAKNSIAEACKELTFALRAFSEAPFERESNGKDATTKNALESDLNPALEGQVLWGLLANLYLQLGRVQESDDAQEHFLKRVEYIRLRRGHDMQSGTDHPEMAGALHNLQILRLRKATAGGPG